MSAFNKTITIVFLLFINHFFAQEVKKDSVETTLKEIVIVAGNPISEKFSVKKLDKLDIYFNPVSNADPLKAINSLPASTNTDETANPSLRGGEADRSRVFINGAPILNPVRNGQDNGLGNFSLFNTEIIDKQYVYASNPPLTYGNSSAGIVEIETNKKIDNESLQFSLALSSVGMLLNKKLKKKSFFQLYGNYQFPDLFIAINKENLPNLEKFSTKDLGLNIHINLSDKSSFNSYNYFIDEFYQAKNYTFNFSGNSLASQRRYFSVNNFDYLKNKSKIRISGIIDFSDKDYEFGNINSKSKYFLCYLSASHKYKFTNKFSVQYGLDSSLSDYVYDEIRPTYYFILDKANLTHKNNDNFDFKTIETYLYTDYEIFNNFGVSLAIRKNIPLGHQLNFLSYQFSSHFEINNKNRFILSLGDYHSYSTPNYLTHAISLLSSFQTALDYYYSSKKIDLTGAIYLKRDGGNFVVSDIEQFDKRKSLGLEISGSYNFKKYFTFSISNSFLNQKIISNNKKYNSDLNLKYFFKSQITYFNPELFSVSLAYTTRPGNFYTKVDNAVFNPNINSFEPNYGELNANSFEGYSRLDFTINKMIAVHKKHALLVYVSINNLLNRKNQSSVYYNMDYSTTSINYYQQRIIYFGLQLRLNGK